MLPSILALEIRESTRRFLIGAYEPADAFFHGTVERFVSADDGLDKGPYLQLDLPFRPGSVGLDFFTGFRLDRPGYKHQEAAWVRLASDRDAPNTLVATVTGSGKTERFMGWMDNESFPERFGHCATIFGKWLCFWGLISGADGRNMEAGNRRVYELFRISVLP